MSGIPRNFESESSESQPLSALSVFDGRYSEDTKELTPYLSEAALIDKRIFVELMYLMKLSREGIVREFSDEETNYISTIIDEDPLSKAIAIKGHEKIVKHDVKAVELFLRDKFEGTSLQDQTENIHYCLTSEDVNNLAYRLMFKESLEQVFMPDFEKVIVSLLSFANENRSIVIMGRTHGQDAVPTTFGKEIAVYADRLLKKYEQLSRLRLTGKLNGAVGSWNSFYFAHPESDWIRISKEFVESLGLEFNPVTTQINPYDDVVEMLSKFHNINGILLDLDQDMWRYISDGWLKQKNAENQVGSSTMPQKVNPINFENSEGNLQIANGSIEALQRTLPISRLQRDLSNSTLVRNVSHIFGYEHLAMAGILKGMSKVFVDQQKVASYLNENWSNLAEPLQTLLRKSGFSDAYEDVRKKVMGRSLSREEWTSLVTELAVDGHVKEELLGLDFSRYIGISEGIVDLVSKKATTLLHSNRDS